MSAQVRTINGLVVITKVLDGNTIGVRIGRTLDEAKSAVDHAGFRVTRERGPVTGPYVAYTPTNRGVQLPGGVALSTLEALNLITRLLCLRAGLPVADKRSAPEYVADECHGCGADIVVGDTLCVFCAVLD